MYIYICVYIYIYLYKQKKTRERGGMELVTRHTDQFRANMTMHMHAMANELQASAAPSRGRIFMRLGVTGRLE